uniref:Syndetin C-terminal domain-containing protein n=1 Tax=Salmo trutta TaxID=8032 RepID=A0A674DAQ9_SALTR
MYLILYLLLYLLLYCLTEITQKSTKSQHVFPVPSCSYGNVKKCSNEGRALMKLDFQQFLMKLEKLTDMRPIPDKDFVETNIKAYYLTENDMEQFIKNHREYSVKHLANLVNGVSGL